MTKITTDAQAMAVLDAVIDLASQHRTRGARGAEHLHTYLAARLASTSHAPDGSGVAIPAAAYDGYRVYMDAKEAHLRGMGDDVTAQHVSSVLDAFVRVVKADSAAPRPVVEKDNG